MLNPWLIAPLILGYGTAAAWLLRLFKPTTKLNHLGNLSTGFSVAFGEELIFRYGIMHLFLINYIGLDPNIALITSASIFSILHFLAGMYRNGIEYDTDIEFIMIAIGLFLLGCVTGKYFLTSGNIINGMIFHAMAIFAVQTLTGIMNNEGAANKWIIDNGHQFIRLPYAWAIMILFLIK